MNLSDLLITYKQVKVPEEAITKIIETPNPIQSKFDRFVSYIENKDKKNTDITKTSEKQDPNAYREFDGKIYGNVNQPTDITKINLSQDDDIINENQDTKVNASPNNVTDEVKNKDTSKVDDRPNILSSEQLSEKYKEALLTEKYTAKQRVEGAQKADGGKNYNEFLTNLQDFYNSDDGKQYDPNNPDNASNQLNLKMLENWLINIAGMETNYKNIPCRNSNSTAYGYFQINKKAAENAGVDHNAMKNDTKLQFKVAFENIFYLYNQLNGWISENATARTIAQNLGKDRFTLMYGMWWRPASVQAYLGLVKDPQKYKEHLYYEETPGGMNIFKILARARESWKPN